MRQFKFVVGCLVLSSFAASASAEMALVAQPSSGPSFTFEALGDPVTGGSWFQDFRVQGTEAFTNLGMQIGNDYAALEGYPSMDFSHGGTSGWAQVYGPSAGGTWPAAASSGTSTTELTWRAHFKGEPETESFTVTLFAYNDIGSNIFDGAVAGWDGSSWSYFGVPSGAEWEDYQDAIGSGAGVAPVPPAALLGMVGLATVATLRRRLA